MDSCGDMLVKPGNLQTKPGKFSFVQLVFFFLIICLPQKVIADTLRIGMDYNYPEKIHLNKYSLENNNIYIVV